MDRKYDNDGYLIVSELDSCPLWERDNLPGCHGQEHDCFYCAFSNFRQEDYIRKQEGKADAEPFYSVCRNEKNKKTTDGGEV